MIKSNVKSKLIFGMLQNAPQHTLFLADPSFVAAIGTSNVPLTMHTIRETESVVIKAVREGKKAIAYRLEGPKSPDIETEDSVIPAAESEPTATV